MELSRAIELDLSGPSKSARSACLERLGRADFVDSSVIEILQSIENVPSNISEYRERERFLENLIKAFREKEVAESEQTHVIVFRYLLGSLYVNFEKFWGPTIRVTIELLDQSKFQARLLRILIDHLVETNDIIYNDFGADQPTFSTEDRPDFVLHRNFIFQLMTKFASFIESNSNQFMDQFFRFVEKELTVSPFIEKFTRDDLCSKKQEQEEREEDDLDCSEDVQKDKPHPNKSKKNTLAKTNLKRAPLSDSLIKKRKSRETFITAAKVIQSFKNISGIHRQQELRDLIFNLLCCRDTSVQKASFNCLLSYRHEFLIPYTDKILKIMNDKMVRTELTLFSVDAEETDQIYDAHRGELMPIIMRILFGKMISKIGRKSSGRDKADLRKTLVMRFIAGCNPNEIEYFFGLLFDPLIAHIETPYCKLSETLATNLDIHNYVPLSKLQAMLSTLTAYMESVGNLKDETLPIVLKMINIISYLVVTPMDNNDLNSQITDKKIEVLKALKRECLKIVSEFFRMFEYYNFRQDEIDFLFKHLIWTSTKGFIDRNHANPTPLLRVIETFASNKAYHKLLVKRNKSNAEEYLLNHIIELYADTKTSRPILKSIASLIADIIDPDRHSPETNDMNDEQICREQTIIEDEDAVVPPYQKSFYKIDKELTFSQEILIGFIPTIFDRLKRNCHAFVSKKDTDSRIENDELLILSTLSEFLKDPEQSLLGARLLLTTLAHQRKGDLIVNTMKAVQVLLKQVGRAKDSTITLLVADILGYQRNQEQRQELCNLLDVLSQVDDKLLPTTEIIRLMNSTSEHLVDLPDLVKWNDGFRQAFNFIDELDESQVNNADIVQDSFILLLYQIGFIINNVDRYEFSIRENCIIFYDKLARKLNLIDPSRNSDLLRTIIDETLLEKFIKKGLRESNDVIKHTFVGVLRSLALHCHTKNKILGEFNLFCNDNQDLDFWLNIRSIQLHNRSKALARLAASDEIHKISPRTLSSYFMPIAAGFLFSKTYKSVSSLAENSIKLIGIICKQLNWVTYESTLSYYIGLLTKANATYQKTNIKLITEILKNFNFDITACKEAMETEEENSKLEKRMKKRMYLTSAEDDSEAIATDAPSGKRLNPSTAKMVYFSVTKKLIPRLNSCLHEMTRVEFEHDKNMADYLPEKEEIKRIPMAYAIVQLLNLLPGRYVLFRDHLPSLFLKLCSFLKSKNEEVRKAARSTLIKIMTFVGPAYMPDLLRVLKQNLDKGFQIHVLNYTIHSILDKIPLQYGCLDHSVHELINLCFQEIFGKIAEDKEIAQILAKTYEAKKTKSYDTLLILSSHISADKLDYLMNSIKELLKTSTDLKKVNKLSTCIQKIFSGLAQNDKFPLDRMLDFMKMRIEESIPSIKIRQKFEQPEMLEVKKDQTKKPLREDRFLIAKELPRDRITSKINEKGNFHMVVENCLRLLLQTFEKNKTLIKRKETHQRKLDDFIALLSACLKSSSPKCVMRSLKCIHFIAQMKADLPSFKTKCNSILKRIFVLLSLYNGVGMVQGDNFEMIGMCFKTISLLLLKCDHVQLNENQIRALLTYIEQDLYDTTRQATAFGTLHSLVQRKCDSPELADIMVKIADLLVTSDDETVRAISIKIWQCYLLNYVHEGSKLQTHLSKFLRQLDYEYIDGRKSVLKILNIVVTNFPEKILRHYYELIFQLLSQRVVNEESAEVRSQVGRLIGLLVQRLPDQQKYLFNQFVIPWGSVSDSPELRLLGIKMTSIFVESCKSQFSADREKVNRILTVLADAMEDKSENSKENDKDSYKLNGNEFNDEEKTQEEEASNLEAVSEPVKLISVNDKLLYHSLRLFKRLIDNKLISCIETRYIGHLKKIWQNIASRMLSHSHLPVVMTACELYLIFIKETELSKSLDVIDPNTDNYLDWNAKRIVRTLCDRFFDLLDRANESNLLLAYITEGLISLSQMITNSNVTREFEKTYMESFEGGDIYAHLLQLDHLPDNGFVLDHLPYKKIEESKKQLDLVWLAIKTVNQARKEAALSRLTTNYRRNFVLRWTAAISQELGAKRLSPYIALFMMTPVRELTDKGKNKSNELSPQNNTVPLSEDLLKFLKSLVGIETFNKIYSKVQLHYTKRRVERKKKEALTKVKNQALGVKKKQVKERKNRIAKVEKGRAMIEKKRGVKRKSNSTAKQTATKKKRSR